MQALDTRNLQARVRLLEGRVEGLRASRRVLMNLLIRQEHEQKQRIRYLEDENRRLRTRVTRYAAMLLERNIRLVRLMQNTP